MRKIPNSHFFGYLVKYIRQQNGNDPFSVLLSLPKVHRDVMLRIFTSSHMSASSFMLFIFFLRVYVFLFVAHFSFCLYSMKEEMKKRRNIDFIRMFVHIYMNFPFFLSFFTLPCVWPCQLLYYMLFLMLPTILLLFVKRRSKIHRISLFAEPNS